MSQILVFGGSIIYGAWDKEGGWVSRLRRFIDKKNLSDAEDYYCLIYNLGVDGNTSENLLERFEFETKQRLHEKESVFIFSIGANDALFDLSRKSHLVSLEKYEENIKKLIFLAKKFSSKIIFLGIAAVDESKTMPVSWDDNLFYKNEYIIKYNKILKSVCEENKVAFVEISNVLTSIDLEDGLHPNSAGHQKIFEIVKEFLIENKII